MYNGTDANSSKAQVRNTYSRKHALYVLKRLRLSLVLTSLFAFILCITNGIVALNIREDAVRDRELTSWAEKHRTATQKLVSKALVQRGLDSDIEREKIRKLKLEWNHQIDDLKPYLQTSKEYSGIDKKLRLEQAKLAASMALLLQNTPDSIYFVHMMQAISKQNSYLQSLDKYVALLTINENASLAKYGQKNLIISIIAVLFVLFVTILVYGPIVKNAKNIFNLYHRQLLRQRRTNINLKQLQVKERKVLEELSHSRARLLLMVENTSDCIFETDFNGNIFFANNAFAEKIGYTMQEILACNYVNLVRSDYWGRVREFYIQAAKRQQVDTYIEFPVVGTNGQEFWLGQSGISVFDNDGKVNRSIFISKDITPINKAAIENGSIQRLTRQMLNNSLDGMVVLRPGHIEVSYKQQGEDKTVQLVCAVANPSATALFGGNGGSLINEPLEGYMPWKQGIIFSEWSLRSWLEQERAPLELEFEHKGKQIILVIWAVKLPDSLILTVREITETRQIQLELERQRNFYENILNVLPSDVVVFSPSQEYVYLNPASSPNEEIRKWLVGKSDFDYCIYRNKPVSFAQKDGKCSTRRWNRMCWKNGRSTLLPPTEAICGIPGALKLYVTWMEWYRW
jgi:PAS domain S-box-containing protein